MSRSIARLPRVSTNKRTGSPCKRCKSTIRYIKSGSCVKCVAACTADWQRNNPDAVRERGRRYGQKHPDRILAKRHKYTGIPLATRPRPAHCECCGRPPKGRVLHLDHDHVTGKFRGWLCFDCNSAIGRLGDSIYGILCALAYFHRVT